MNTAVLDSDTLTLTPDQQAALDAFLAFIADPVETVFVLEGYSGCGKSTLVRTMHARLPGFEKTLKLIDPTYKGFEVIFTATTNKAAENLARITGMEVQTLQSFLGLRVHTDFRTNITTLIPRANFSIPEGMMIFVDEASFIDGELLGLTFSRTRNCKIVFIGDPAQLAPVKSVGTPVFNAGFTGAALTQVVRQAEGNPIVDLSTSFRNTVNTSVWTPFKPDGHYVCRVDRDAFNKAIEEEFTRPDWRYADSKILAWTNKCVIAYNQYVRNLVKGDPHFQVGDYAVCNSYLSIGRQKIKTDQLVQITKIEPEVECHDVRGSWMTVDYSIRVFQPNSLAEKNARIKQARVAGNFGIAWDIESSWIDLRGAYGCTINKAQGSTFDSVFIDLDDISRCHNGDQLARMLYVAVSRARNHVYLIGDLA